MAKAISVFFISLVSSLWFYLVVFQDLSHSQACILADAVQLADGVNGGMAPACYGVERLATLYFVEMG